MKTTFSDDVEKTIKCHIDAYEHNLRQDLIKEKFENLYLQESKNGYSCEQIFEWFLSYLEDEKHYLNMANDIANFTEYLNNKIVYEKRQKVKEYAEKLGLNTTYLEFDPPQY